MSALISGVKNFVFQKISFVRALPFSQVQSASENGSIFLFSVPVCAGLSRFGPIPTAAASVALELEKPALGAPVDTIPAAVADAATAPPPVVAGTFGFSLASNSATRRS